MAVANRFHSGMPRNLRALQDAALKLATAAYRFAAEVPPAVRNCIDDVQLCDRVCECMQPMVNGIGLRPAHEAWHFVQTDMGKMLEFEGLLDHRSKLIPAAKGLIAMMMDTVAVAKKHAPASNPQMGMFSAELNMILDDLEATIKELATR